MASEGDKRWDGIRDDESIMGDGLATGQGVSFAVNGELRRRPGLTAAGAFGGPSVFSFRSPVTGAWAVIVTAAGTIESLSL